MNGTYLTMDLPSYYFSLSVWKKISSTWNGKMLRENLKLVSASLGIFMDEQTSKEVLRSFLSDEVLS